MTGGSCPEVAGCPEGAGWPNVAGWPEAVGCPPEEGCPAGVDCPAAWEPAADAEVDGGTDTAAGLAPGDWGMPWLGAWLLG